MFDVIFEVSEKDDRDATHCSRVHFDQSDKSYSFSYTNRIRTRINANTFYYYNHRDI